MTTARSKQWGLLQSRRIRLFDHLWLAINSRGVQGFFQLQSAMLQHTWKSEKRPRIWIWQLLLTSIFVYTQMPLLPGNWENLVLVMKCCYSYDYFPSKLQIIIFPKKRQLRINSREDIYRGFISRDNHSHFASSSNLMKKAGVWQCLKGFT